MPDEIILAAINVVRQEFGHGPLPVNISDTAAQMITHYLKAPSSINDDTNRIRLYQAGDSAVVIFDVNPDAQIIAGETWTWVMLDATTKVGPNTVRVVSQDTVDRLNLPLPELVAVYE
jgi:hypothetical protein